ncbi:RDD family protein [Sulfitobacter sp. F26169L]|uniref:RDD family protein n=1 Tax=Sulfitobacter sp. F26169L TaxID=2996015 RepID=UPI00226098AA|nr:RDD family protein [Sulfitobacter sp. F26169L]MCX7565283.1 RDD family protein [Sulfitobacter sp. F26169L]
MTPDPDLQPQFYDGIPTKRLLAWVVDVVIIAVLTMVVIPFTAFIGLFFLPFLFMVLSFAYRVVTLSRGSATWGMQLMAIELRTRDDQRFDLPTAFLHTLGYSFSIAMAPLQLVSVVLMLSTDRRQGLTDMALGTVALNRRAV